MEELTNCPDTHRPFFGQFFFYSQVRVKNRAVFCSAIYTDILSNEEEEGCQHDIFGSLTTDKQEQIMLIDLRRLFHWGF